MDIIGRIKEIYRSSAGKTLVLLEIDDGRTALPGLEKLTKLDKLAICLKQWRKKRSLDANAYHWVLCGKIADVIDSDADSVHYDLMIRYGTEEDDDEQGRPIVSVLPHVDLRKAEIYGRLIGEGYVNGKRFLHYLLIK